MVTDTHAYTSTDTLPCTRSLARTLSHSCIGHAWVDVRFPVHRWGHRARIRVRRLPPLVIQTALSPHIRAQPSLCLTHICKSVFSLTCTYTQLSHIDAYAHTNLPLSRSHPCYMHIRTRVRTHGCKVSPFSLSLPLTHTHMHAHMHTRKYMYTRKCS